MAAGRHYTVTDLEPHLSVQVLYSGDQIVSFDVYYFSQVITFANGTVKNLIVKDGHHGPDRFTSEPRISPSMLDYIRKRLPRLEPAERGFIERALDASDAVHNSGVAG